MVITISHTEYLVRFVAAVARLSWDYIILRQFLPCVHENFVSHAHTHTHARDRTRSKGRADENFNNYEARRSCESGSAVFNPTQRNKMKVIDHEDAPGDARILLLSFSERSEPAL